MIRARVTKVFHFEAAHALHNHDGKCRRPHGHSYRVEVVCEGPINGVRGDAKEGMVIDFADIKKVWRQELEPLLDHQNLNETIGDWVLVTTAERIAVFILGMFRHKGIPIYEVSVWETATSCATVKYSEAWSNGEG